MVPFISYNAKARLFRDHLLRKLVQKILALFCLVAFLCELMERKSNLPGLIFKQDVIQKSVDISFHKVFNAMKYLNKKRMSLKKKQLSPASLPHLELVFGS